MAQRDVAQGAWRGLRSVHQIAPEQNRRQDQRYAILGIPARSFASRFSGGRG